MGLDEYEKTFIPSRVVTKDIYSERPETYSIYAAHDENSVVNLQLTSDFKRIGMKQVL